MNLYQGNLHIATSKFAPGGTQGIAFIGSPDNNQTVDLEGAQTISLSIYDSMKNGGTKASDGVSIYGQAKINQNTADQSTWSGNANLDGTSMTLSAVSGGRLIYSGILGGDAPAGLTITGTGTVVLASAGGNTFDERDGNGHLQPTSTAAATLTSGSTTLITNTSGSAFGRASNGDATYNNAGSHNLPVNIQSGAILGGTGISTNPIQALAADSVIAPGEYGQANLGIAPSIGTLHLNGGIVATSGLTMDFKLNGLTYDSIDFGGTSTVTGGTINFDNVITFNLTGTVVISAANNNGIYKLLTGMDLTDSVQGSNMQFVFNAPVGYKVETWNTVAGTTPGKNDYLYVQFALAPEPSTYGLLGLGLLGLVAVRRFRRLSA